MARKSKFTQYDEAALTRKNLWRAGLYVRLSREDGDKEESDSIANQRALLQDYIAFEEDVELCDVYIDDGYSGTNFDRPNFLRMMEDVKTRAINCVIVKDLSRFGRNYIEVGQYIEKTFPLLDVRFISVNDMLDSVKNPQAMNNIIVPFKNIINDEYCHDISNKVRSSLDMKRKQGKFIGSFPSYGYAKDPQDHNHLVIDEEAAEIVRMIYRLFLGGTSIIGIAKKLNALGILNPTAYKCAHGMRYRHPSGKRNDKLWPDSSVRRILTNRVYTGCLVQGKNRIKSYKLQVAVAVPKDQWIIVPDTHDAIIARDVFDKVQEVLCRDTRTAPGKDNVYVLSGFMRCADCGRAMNRKLISQPQKNYCYYICSTFKKMERGACTKHAIRSDRVETAVLETIKKQIDLAVSMDELVAAINEKGEVRKESDKLKTALHVKESERKKIENMKLDLYPDWKSGAISKLEYQKLKLGFDAQLNEIEGSILKIKEAMEEAEAGVDGSNAFLTAFTSRKNLTALTREIMIELVDTVYVHEGGAITIRFKFADAYEQAVEFIEQNKALLTA